MPAEALQKLRAKYPQYQDIPDQELARRIITKYPDYQDILGDVASGRAVARPGQPATPRQPGLLERASGAVTRAVSYPGEKTEEILTGGLGYGEITRRAIPGAAGEVLGHPLSPAVVIPRLVLDPLTVATAGAGAVARRAATGVRNLVTPPRGLPGPVIPRAVTGRLSRPSEYLTTQGAGGREIVSRATAVERGANQAETRIATEVSRLPKLSTDEAKNLSAVLEGEATPVSANVQAWVSHYQPRMAHLGQRLEQSGLHAYTREEGARAFQARRQYSPHIPDPAAIRTAVTGRSPQARAALEKFRQDNNLRSLKAAENELLVRRGRALGERYAGFQHVREGPLPPELRLRADKALPLHEAAVERRLLEAQHYGRTDELLQLAARKVAEEGGDAPFAAQAVSQLTRRLPSVPGAEKAATAVSNIVTLTTMGPLSTVRQGQQILNTARITGLRAVAQAAKLARTPGGQEALARTGALHSSAMHEAFGLGDDASRAVDRALTAYGFLGLDKYWRALSGLAGRQWGRMLLADVKRGGNAAAKAITDFHRAGIDIQAAQARGPAAVEQSLDDLGWWVARETQFGGGKLSSPFWMQAPLGRAVMILRRFAYQQQAWQWRYLVQEARRDPYKTAQFIVGATLAGEAIQDVAAVARGVASSLVKLATREKPTIDDFRTEYARRPDSLHMRLIDNFLAGTGGIMIANMFQSVAQGARRPGEAARRTMGLTLGVAGEKAASLIGAGFESAARGTVKPILREVPRVLLPPPVGREVSETLAPPALKRIRPFIRF